LENKQLNVWTSVLEFFRLTSYNLRKQKLSAWGFTYI